MSDQKMHNGECYRACGCDPVAQARADERQRNAVKLKARAGQLGSRACCYGTGECGERECQISEAVIAALISAADLIESETSKP